MTGRLSDELLALILDPVEDLPVVELDADGTIVRWTAGAAAMLGYDAVGALSRHVSALYPEEEVERGRPGEDLRLASEMGYLVRDGWARRADGSRFWARRILRSRRNEREELTGFVKLTCDLTDQLDVMRGLVAADQRLAALVELAVDGIVSTDENGMIVLFNRGAERLFGYDRQELIGKPLGMLVPAHLREAHERHMRSFRAGRLDADRMAQGRVVTALAKDGREFPIEATISRLELDHGAIFSVILRDASERVMIEAELRGRLARARQLADALPFPIHYLDRDLTHVFANTAVADWLGVPADELVGMSLEDAARAVGSSETFGALRPHLEAALRGEQRRFVGRARDAESAVHDLEILIAPSRDTSGNVEGCYVVSFDRREAERDDTARRLLSTAAGLSGAGLEGEVAMDGLVRLAATDFADGCVGFLSEGEKVLRFGEDPPERADRLPHDDVPPGVRQVLQDGHARSYTDVDDRATFLAVPVPCTEDPGGALLFRWAPPFDPSEQTVDVAEELGRQLGAALDRAALARRATEAVQTRNWLLRKVTHDLGNPVAAIVMVADRLLRTIPAREWPEGGRALLEGVKQQAGEMRLIIEELLDVRALTGKASLQPRAVDVAALLEQAASLIEPIAAGRGVELAVEPPEVPGSIVADPAHLRHALVALLSDHLGRSGRGERIRLAARAAVDVVRFEVSGPALGAPGEEVERLLDERTPPLARQSTTFSLSLSLAVANEIVRNHGARISIDDGDEGSAAYRFELPAL
jgi:PAS domain S-box-containing protein